MIKKLLSSILITLLFVTNVFASDVSVYIDVNNNNANIKLTGINKDIHALQLNITDENANTNIEFKPAKNFTYSYLKQTTENNKTTISIVIDNSSSLTENGILNLGSLTFKSKPKLSKIVDLELINLNENLQGNTKQIDANITVKEDNNNTSSNQGSSSNSSSGSNIGSSLENNKPNEKPSIKPEDNKIDINLMYPVIRESNFTDIDGHWAKEAIKYLSDRGIINGMSNTSFAPNNNITRAEFITLLAKMDNIDINKYKSERFTDVPANAWFNPYVDWASKVGITSGVSNTSFAPNSNITREQMAVMIEKFCNYKQFKLSSNKPQISFTDSNNISSYAKNAVVKVQQAGIINGRPDGSFAPKANATRAEAAQMIYTMLTIQ